MTIYHPHKFFVGVAIFGMAFIKMDQYPIISTFQFFIAAWIMFLSTKE